MKFPIRSFSQTISNYIPLHLSSEILLSSRYIIAPAQRPLLARPAGGRSCQRSARCNVATSFWLPQASSLHVVCSPGLSEVSVVVPRTRVDDAESRILLLLASRRYFTSTYTTLLKPNGLVLAVAAA